MFSFFIQTDVIIVGVVPEQANEMEKETRSGNGIGQEKAGTSRRLRYFRYRR